jgi:glycosyltransferase involved in cell wall biosynthesis
MHLYMLSILLKYPGIVLLHDVRLVGLYRDYAINTFPDNPKSQRDYYRQLIVEFEKGFVDVSLLPEDIFEKNEPLIESGVFLVRQVLQSATRVFVTSEYAKTICNRYPEVAHKITTQSFGHVLFDDTFFEEREKRQAYNERMTGVVALPIYILGGFNLYSKKLDVILEAAQLVNRRRMKDPSLGIPFFEVKFVGFSFEEFFEQMVAAQRDGLQVSILGRVSEETYLECLKNATLGIQLRTPSNGERSGALSDLMAAGVPVIVTQGRSSADVEQGATLQVPEGQHTVEGLALYLERLLVEVKLRERIGWKAKEYALRNSFDVAAAHYLTYVAAEERRKMEK